jgi:PAS domain S-box-containing protein
LLETHRLNDTGYLETILNAVQTGILMIDSEDHRIVYGNPAAFQVIGYSKERVIGSVCHSFICPAEAGKCPITDIGQTIDNSERALIDARGERVPVLKTVVPTVIEGRGYLVESFLDIRTRKQFEVELGRHNESLKELHNHASQLSLANTVEEIATYTLDAIEHTLGFHFADMALVEDQCVRVVAYRGHPAVLWEAHLDDARSIKVQVANTKKTVRVPDTRKEPAYVDGRGFDWTGPPTMLSELAVPVLVDGEAVAVLNVENEQPNAFTNEDQALLEILAVHVASDLRRLKHLEALRKHEQHLEELVSERTRKLSESEKRFRELTNLLPETVFELDANGKLTFLNQAGLKVIGHNENDLKTGLSAFQVVAPENHKALKENIGRILNGGPSPGYEYMMLRKDGSRFPGIAYASPIIKEEKAVGLRGVVVDITERKRLEERLIRSEHLAAIGETASMVAHDLRNPLQGITGAAYVLRGDSLTVDEKNRMLHVIERSVEYAEATVRDLMDYSREIQLERAEVSPKSISQSALQAVRVPGNVKVQDMSKEQPKISVDPDMMKRFFINLVENAIDAMPKGGTITIDTQESNGYMEITISDTGTGMPEKVMENLWKPLQTTKAKGMGLGLPIVKRIVDAHGGEIAVKTRSGEGTTFTIRLPIKIASKA